MIASISPSAPHRDSTHFARVVGCQAISTQKKRGPEHIPKAFLQGLVQRDTDRTRHRGGGSRVTVPRHQLPLSLCRSLRKELCLLVPTPVNGPSAQGRGDVTVGTERTCCPGRAGSLWFPTTRSHSLCVDVTETTSVEGNAF